MQSHPNRDFAWTYKYDKVNYRLQLFPSVILLNKLSLLYD